MAKMSVNIARNAIIPYLMPAEKIVQDSSGLP
jgi:hypothetical protein